mmetsp:Transcript_5995/g.12823  ORF Transcript_5995/g.12823 Transcript_5995/m.12823 type:complete len:1009 (-) Transcript_5995:290-3316(-)
MSRMNDGGFDDWAEDPINVKGKGNNEHLYYKAAGLLNVSFFESQNDRGKKRDKEDSEKEYDDSDLDLFYEDEFGAVRRKSKRSRKSILDSDKKSKKNNNRHVYKDFLYLTSDEVDYGSASEFFMNVVFRRSNVHSSDTVKVLENSIRAERWTKRRCINSDLTAVAKPNTRLCRAGQNPSVLLLCSRDCHLRQEVLDRIDRSGKLHTSFSRQRGMLNFPFVKSPFDPVPNLLDPNRHAGPAKDFIRVCDFSLDRTSTRVHSQHLLRLLTKTVLCSAGVCKDLILNNLRNVEKKFNFLKVFSLLYRMSLTSIDLGASKKSRGSALFMSDRTFETSIFPNIRVLDKLKYTDLNDKYAEIMHNNQFDLKVVRLTLSALITQIGIAFQHLDTANVFSSNAPNQYSDKEFGFVGSGSFDSKNRNEGAKEVLSLTNDFLRNCVETVTPLELTGFEKSNSGSKEILTLLTQSFLCHCNLRTDDNEKSNGMAIVGRSLADFGRFYINDPLLASFSSIHITTGISFITSSFTSNKSINILGESCTLSGHSFQTPFELLSRALEEQIHYTEFSMGRAMLRLELKSISKALTKAAQIFHSCCKHDRTHLDSQNWRLAALAGLMVISSGLPIGKQFKPQEITENVDDFEKVREDVIICFQDLLSVTNDLKNNEALYHLSVASFLEWREARNLLIYFNPQLCFELNKAHTFHMLKWSENDVSISAIKRMNERSLQENNSNAISFNAMASNAANLVESYPENHWYWADLVHILGKVGNDARKSPALKCNKRSCGECSILKTGYQLYHKPLSYENESDWWGRGRDWWESFFFGPMPPVHSQVHEDWSQNGLDSVFQDIVYIAGSMTTIQESNFDRDDGEIVSIASDSASQNACLDFDRSIKTKNNDFKINFLIENLRMEKLLESQVFEPTKLNSRLPSKMSTAPKNLKQNGFKLNLDGVLIANPIYQIVALKVVVACHLFGTLHSFVNHGIEWLVNSVNKNSQNEVGDAKNALGMFSIFLFILF